ncbi:MAG: TonB-dependent receptor [Sulfurospirillaceae bacterium]|nr:TonB-dependent receptor [Sulfurospirillaceae bacterium]
MNKKICLSVICALCLNAYATDLGTIEVSGLAKSKVIEDISKEEIKSADLADALYKQTPSIEIVRRSGIANDIILRGQKRDNIVVTVDDAKVYGACPNRMDPPTSHIVVSNIDNVVVSEGPYNVEDFGVLSGSVKVETKKPQEGFHGNVYTNLGSFNYKKIGTTLSGGNDKIRFIITGSKESSDQYKDGDGKTFAQQLEDKAPAMNQLKPEYKDMKAFVKTSMMAKTFIKVSENQDLELSYTRNRSDNILYPNTGMDALYDNSDIFNFKYTILGLGKLSKRLQLQAYNSKVKHPMSTKYRVNSGVNFVNELTSLLTTEMTGAKIINDMDLNGGLFTLGLDASKRNWNGYYIGNGTTAGMTGKKSIDDVDTINSALFAKYNRNLTKKLNLQFGARYDHTKISTANASYEDRYFNALSANVLATYKINTDLKLFAGLGNSSRVPDARELYFWKGGLIGTPTLKQTHNTEFDIGAQKDFDSGYIKSKAFYSILNNYIYFHKGQTPHAFENIDAKIYGLEISGSYDLSDNLYIDYGLAYQRGRKDQPLAGQTSKDLADIPPLKTNIALNYNYNSTTKARVELIAAKSWSEYDADNGEQKIPGYGIINIRAQKTFHKNIEATVGIDNLFDKTYAVSNTYADLSLLSDGSTGNVMLLNEPGRYVYFNLKYKF